MAKTKLEEMYEMIAMTCSANLSVKTVERCLKAFYKLILQQLAINGKIKISKFGTFYLHQKEERVIKVGDPVNRGTKYVYVEPKFYITFTPSSCFENDINKFREEKTSQFKVKRKKFENEKKTRSKRYISIDESLADIFNKEEKRSDK